MPDLPPSPPRMRSDGINPGCESRGERIVGRVTLVCFAAVICWGTVSVLFIPSRVSLASMLIPVGAFTIGATLAHRIAARRARREVIAADYCLCLECRYPLATLPAGGTCPECGAAYEHEQVRTCWEWTLDEHWRS
ncbi:MAG: hypothetical protein KF869_00930 [Phycisphaeraceae bacterium]|nr:hypothetical protein [Phycisphaeraceae bacterium]